MQGFTVLHVLATKQDSSETADMLLSRGANVDSMSTEGTPLHFAAQCGNVEMMAVLLKYNANPNSVVQGSYAPLTLALFGSSLKCVDLLIKAGANVNAGRPVTPLIIAARAGLADCIKLLLKAGAYPNNPDEAMETGRKDADLYARRCLCWLELGKKDEALDDANTCRNLGLYVSIRYHEQGTALLPTKDYGQACGALVSRLKLDSGSGPDGEVSREEDNK
uniref:Uncharacterized protein n=1 Tax=Avena sativa TaxID=4498 RepID=A0ACD5TXQ4_AVESA